VSSDDEDCSLGHPVVGVHLLGKSDLGCGVVGVDLLEGVSVFGVRSEGIPDGGAVEGEGSEELVDPLLETKGPPLPAPPGRSESIEPVMVPGSTGVLTDSEEALFSCPGVPAVALEDGLVASDSGCDVKRDVRRVNEPSIEDRIPLPPEEELVSGEGGVDKLWVSVDDPPCCEPGAVP